MGLFLVLLDSKIPELNIKTHVTSTAISVFVDSRTGCYDVTISNVEGKLYVENSLFFTGGRM